MYYVKHHKALLDAAWLAELREAQHEQPLGLFGDSAENVLWENRSVRSST